MESNNNPHFGTHIKNAIGEEGSTGLKKTNNTLKEN